MRLRPLLALAAALWIGTLAAADIKITFKNVSRASHGRAAGSTSSGRASRGTRTQHSIFQSRNEPQMKGPFSVPLLLLESRNGCRGCEGNSVSDPLERSFIRSSWRA